jgi:hypothetical protein
MGKPPEEEVRDAADLHAAPWLLCSFDTDAAAGIPEGMTWNWRKRQFEPLKRPATAPWVFFFDGEKRRMTYRSVYEWLDGSLELAPPEDAFKPGARVFQNQFLIVVQLEAPAQPEGFQAINIAISHIRTPDGRFTAIMQTLFFPFLSTAADPAYAPGACATTAKEPLKQAIDAARAKWLAEPIAKPDVPPEAEPPPMPEDHKAEP